MGEMWRRAACTCVVVGAIAMVGAGCTAPSTAQHHQAVVHPGIGCQPGELTVLHQHWKGKINLLATLSAGTASDLVVKPRFYDAHAKMTDVAVALVKPGHGNERYPLRAADVISEAHTTNETRSTLHAITLPLPGNLTHGRYPVIDQIAGRLGLRACSGGRATTSSQLGTVQVKAS